MSTKALFRIALMTAALLALTTACLDSGTYDDGSGGATADTVGGGDGVGTDSVAGDGFAGDGFAGDGFAGDGWAGDGGGGDGWTTDGGDSVTPDTTQETETIEETCEPVDIPECEVEITAPMTSPTPQDYVLVTGTMNSWAQSEADGAIPMAVEGANWITSIPLTTAQTYEYKFLIKWPDTEQKWCTFMAGDWECTPGSGNMTVTVDCGQTDCGDLPPPGTCDDGKQNQGEQGVDCGGPCEPCVTDKDYDWHDAILYFVFIDRFHDSDGAADEVAGVPFEANYQGGDLQGVKAKLPYLAELGVNTLWLTAPFENRDTAGAGMGDDPNTYSGFHGYWPSPDEDGLAVESRIGTADDLKDLIDTAHEQYGMKILLDYVMNHVDDESGLYQAHKNDGWFHDPFMCGQDCGWKEWCSTTCAFTDYLPAFDFNNADARAWSVNDAMAWAKEFNVDGYRLDAIKHVELSWLTDLRTALNAEFPDKAFYLVGETFEYDNCGYIQSFVDPDTKLDGQFDFPLRKRLGNKILNPNPSEKLGDLEGDLAWLDGCYPGAIMSTFIGNHDLPRVIHLAEGKFGSDESGAWGKGWIPNDYPASSDAGAYKRVALAFTIMLTIPGVPLIYYGDEIGLPGGADPDNRRMMEWDDAKLNDHQKWLRERIAKLNKIRSENEALRYGQRQAFEQGWDTYGYRMSNASGELFVLINRSGAVADMSGVPAGSYTDLVSGQAIEVNGAISVPGQEAMILQGS
jgi:glycosidase